MSEPKTVDQLLTIAVRVLDDSTHLFDDHDHDDEAQELLSMVLDTEDLDEVPDDFIPPKRDRERFLALVARRAGGEPFPFLTGRIEIYGLTLKVRPGAFVPRPSSELTIDLAVKKMKRKKGAVIVDVCAGQGPIALCIAHELPAAQVYGCDIDAGGLAQGRANARELGLDNTKFLAGDMYAPLPARLKGNVDLIVGHVPYVPMDEIDDLPAEVREYEPLYTLSDESVDGLTLMRRAVAESVEWLAPGGWLMLELAEDLSKKVLRMCKKAGFTDLVVRSDEDDLSVVVEGRLPKARTPAR
jgi:release factor glutamine methyltransferase